MFVITVYRVSLLAVNMIPLSSSEKTTTNRRATSRNVSFHLYAQDDCGVRRAVAAEADSLLAINVATIASGPFCRHCWPNDCRCF